jgi:hypothetical protein
LSYLTGFRRIAARVQNSRIAEQTGRVAMSIAVYLNPKGMSLEQYEEIHRRLQAAGHGHEQERLHHSCFGLEGNLMVYDIWTSEESWQAFGGVLMPILAELGVDPGQPAVMPLHKLIQSESA